MPENKQDLKTKHERRFGKPDCEVWTPGRINLIGEHTDYNNGYVLPAAIDSGISFLFSLNSDEEQFELYSANLDQYESFRREDGKLPPQNWAKYLQALIQLLREEDITVPGFSVSLSSSIPTGGGLSSSAALNAGFILAINKIGNHEWSIKKMARLAQYTEHRIGVRVGIMDPYAILAGKKNHFIKIDCRTDTYERIPADMKGHVLLLLDTGISHDLADSEYNERRQTCENILYAAQHFRDVKDVSALTDEDLVRIRSHYPDLSTAEVEYVLAENQRVIDVVGALTDGNMDEVGQLMYQSHAGLRDQYRVSCDELDFLVDQAQSHAIPGARMMGGGFGGSTINLLPEIQLKSFVEEVTRAYYSQFGWQPTCLLVHPADGGRLGAY